MSKCMKLVRHTFIALTISGVHFYCESALNEWERVWYDNETEKSQETSLITAAFPLADQSRLVEKGFKGPTTVYE